MPLLTQLGVAAARPDPNARPGEGEEARLVRQVATGDLRAFEQLYRLYGPRLTRFILNMIHRPHLAEEVLDDTMLVVWNRSGTFDGSSRVSTWIFAIAYRRALNALRSHREPMEDKHAERRPSPEPSPEEEIGQKELQAVLKEAMEALSADHRTVVELTYYHCLGYREIAQIMDCPVDTVKTRMFHARRHLRRVLAGRLSDWL